MTDRRPNLQNIPIRTAEGRRIRDAFLPRGPMFFGAAADGQAPTTTVAEDFAAMFTGRRPAVKPTTLDECPACHADLTGQEIPSNVRHLYGRETHYSRCIGLSDMRLDRVTHWKCPDCGHEWDRT